MGSVKTKPEPGYTYDVQYGEGSAQPGQVERVGDVRLAELGEDGEDFTVVESYKVEGYAEHVADARKAGDLDVTPKTEVAAPENPED